MFQVWLVGEEEPHEVTGDEFEVRDGTLRIFTDSTSLPLRVSSVYAAGAWRACVRAPEK
jgi:hypothetical protein